jgi:hypothetical protein
MTTENGTYEIYGVAGRCNEITMFFSKDGYETQKLVFPNNSTDTILLQPTAKQQTTIFDINKDFDIIELEKSNDYPSSDKDTTVCSNRPPTYIFSDSSPALSLVPKLKIK